MELSEIPDLVPSLPTVPPLFSACVSSVLRNNLDISPLPAETKQAIENLRAAPGLYCRKSFVLQEEGPNSFWDPSEFADRQLVVSQSENFGEWIIQSHVPANLVAHFLGQPANFGMNVTTRFTINVPTNGGSVHCGIAGDIVDPIDSCYYTSGGIHLHGVSTLGSKMMRRVRRRRKSPSGGRWTSSSLARLRPVQRRCSSLFVTWGTY